jgi:hypothetical protein
MPRSRTDLARPARKLSDILGRNPRDRSDKFRCPRLAVSGTVGRREALTARWERLGEVRTWAAVLAFACFLAGTI